MKSYANCGCSLVFLFIVLCKDTIIFGTSSTEVERTSVGALWLHAADKLHRGIWFSDTSGSNLATETALKATTLEQAASKERCFACTEQHGTFGSKKLPRAAWCTGTPLLEAGRPGAGRATAPQGYPVKHYGKPEIIKQKLAWQSKTKETTQSQLKIPVFNHWNTRWAFASLAMLGYFLCLKKKKKNPFLPNITEIPNIKEILPNITDRSNKEAP